MPHSPITRRRTPLLLTFVSAAGLLILPGCGESLPPIDGIEVTITAENFDSEVMESELPVLLDFWAEWCGPCRRLEPVLAHLSVNYEGRLKVGKVNVEEQRELATRFGISPIPTLILMQDGEPIATRTGATTLSHLSSWVDEHLPAGTPAAETASVDPEPAGDRL